MYRFPQEQQIVNIDGVKIGGQPGQLSTVLIGSMFYEGDNIVKKSKEGVIDRKEARKHIQRVEDESHKTGNPYILDVVGSWPTAMTKYIDFAATATDAPLSLDCADRTVALAALKHVAEVGLTDRVIFNSINPRTKPDVYAALREAKVTSVILLTLNERKPTVSGRLDVLDRAYTTNGMITNLQEAGIENILVDTTVLAIPDLGPASKAIYLVKEKYGFPAGCGAHNALERWKERKKLDQKTQIIGSVAIHVMPITMGADFLLYGPISNAPDIFMACALADAYVAYLMRQHYRINPLTRDHPLLKIFI